MTRAQRRIEQRAGLKLAASTIAAFEGGMSHDGRFHAYWDKIGGVWTIGYGDTKNVRPGMIWSHAKAVRMLKRRLATEYAPTVDRLGLPLKRHMYATLCSFIWNEGPGALAATTGIGRELRAHHWNKAADALLVWNKAQGKVVAGLTNRRRAERALFLRDL